LAVEHHREHLILVSPRPDDAGERRPREHPGDAPAVHAREQHKQHRPHRAIAAHVCEQPVERGVRRPDPDAKIGVVVARVVDTVRGRRHQQPDRLRPGRPRGLVLRRKVGHPVAVLPDVRMQQLPAHHTCPDLRPGQAHAEHVDHPEQHGRDGQVAAGLDPGLVRNVVRYVVVPLELEARIGKSGAPQVPGVVEHNVQDAGVKVVPQHHDQPDGRHRHEARGARQYEERPEAHESIHQQLVAMLVDVGPPGRCYARLHDRHLGGQTGNVGGVRCGLAGLGCHNVVKPAGVVGESLLACRTRGRIAALPRAEQV